MGKRARIGLSYYYNENWIGGTYYIENLVNALNTLPDEEKPELMIICEKQHYFQKLKEVTSYPYLEFQISTGERNPVFQFLNRISYKVFRRYFFSRKIKGTDMIFPYAECEQFSSTKKKLFWIPDFQEHFAPEFFSVQEIDNRKEVQKEVAYSGNEILFSSNDVKGHFVKLYPGHNLKIHVVPFAVTHPDLKTVSFETIQDLYGIQRPYFICPNQFWKHKNQATVLRAIKELKMRGHLPLVVFTGNTTDRRNPGYYDEILETIKELGIDSNVRMLGFIDRKHQLALIKNSCAVIQPSLFEGWSTVVEDAKALNKFVVASDLDVHKEQLTGSSAIFFNPKNEFQLADCMEPLIARTETELFRDYNYERNRIAFGRSFLKILAS